jgi:hypothetical protein
VRALRSRLEVLLDVFNLPNLGANQRFEFGANQTFSPTFRTRANRQLPRSAALSVRVSF